MIKTEKTDTVANRFSWWFEQRKQTINQQNPACNLTCQLGRSSIQTAKLLVNQLRNFGGVAVLETEGAVNLPVTALAVLTAVVDHLAGYTALETVLAGLNRVTGGTVR